MKIPGVLEKLFDSVPIHKFPAVSNNGPDHKASIENHKYYFITDASTTSSTSSNGSFIFGVNNIIKVKGKYIPSDPISLGSAFALCEKNKLKFPDGTSKSGHCMIALSYHASPDKHLPIMLEDSLGSRTIRLHGEINQIFYKNKTSPVSESILHMIDTELYDIWLAALLLEADIEALRIIFNLKTSIPATEKLYTSALIQDVTNWRDFQLRHENLFSEYKILDNKALEFFYSAKLEFLSSLLPQFQSVISQDIDVELKIAAFIISIDQTLKNTKLGLLISNSELLQHSYKVLAKY